VDRAQNRSALSLSTPPVYCPDVTPPRAPVITKILGGNREITLKWSSNREPDLKEYQVYRSESAEDAHDLRLMTWMHTESELRGVSDRPAEVSWTDKPVPGLIDFFYRLITVDTTGNISNPTSPQQARAYDEVLPAVPNLLVGWSALTAPADAQLEWTASEESLVEIRPVNQAIWQPVTPWVTPGTHRVNVAINPTRAWRFRLRVRKATGALSIGPTVGLAALP
jgi:hypothetical protein